MDVPNVERPVVMRLALEVRDGEHRQRPVPSVIEEPLAIEINGQRVAVLMRLPGDEKELAVGYCVSEGLLGGVDDILLLHHCGQGLPEPTAMASSESGGGEQFSRNIVEIRTRTDRANSDPRLAVVRLIRAGCGAADVANADLELSAIASSAVVSPDLVVTLGRALRDEQLLHNAVGGVHDAALFDLSGELLCLAEDVGRHNAVDKVLGYCLLRRIALRDRLLVCSGRLSYEMVVKAVRMGLPFLASLSAPTSLAVELADRFGLTLIGYLRGSRMTVYTHPERVAEPAG